MLRVFALVPAAGRGQRFGGAKLLAKWQDRELLGHVLVKLGGARAAGLIVNTIVVHRPDDEAIRSLAAEYRAYPVATRDPDGELSHSLRTGIEAIGNRNSAHDQSAIVICLGDQPLLRLDVIRTLVDAWSRGGGGAGGGGAMAVRPSYRDSPGEPGHPLLLDRSLWYLAAEMRGESGFAPVLANRGINVRSIVVGGKNPDIDTPEDLSALDQPASAEAPSLLSEPEI